MVKQILTLLIIFPTISWAVPIDWHGTFGVDTTLVNNYTRIEEPSTPDGRQPRNPGTQEIPLAEDGESGASWQSYLFKLTPVIIVNDAATFKGEISSGYARGGRLGDGMAQSRNLGMGNALYPHNFSDSDNALILNKFFVELYADTATYKIGRHHSHFGLGAVVNAGEEPWDRFSSVRDGITLDIRLGNFFLSPYWAQISDTLSEETNIKEYGIQMNYKNIAQDVSFGILYNRKTNANFHSLMKTGINDNYDEEDKEMLDSIGGADVTITDFYFQKKLRDFQFSLEIPLVSGTLGHLFGNNGGEINYTAKAIIFESSYQFNPKWSLYVNAGQVSGDSGANGQFEAMYLNPNYQIANLLFRYNRTAVSNKNLNIYDSYLTNTRYFKIAGEHSTQKWTWNWAVIQAWAMESAKVGQRSFNHRTNKRFDAKQSQNDDLGLEFDVNFKYRWNSAISISGSFGYLLSGAHWEFTNDPEINNNTQNSYALQLQTAVTF